MSSNTVFKSDLLLGGDLCFRASLALFVFFAFKQFKQGHRGIIDFIKLRLKMAIYVAKAIKRFVA
jgi:hypothetical protein